LSSDYGRIHGVSDSDEELIKSSDTATPAVVYRGGHAEGTIAVYGECDYSARLTRVDRRVSEAGRDDRCRAGGRCATSA
jgi:hypothetical protein